MTNRLVDFCKYSVAASVLGCGLSLEAQAGAMFSAEANGTLVLESVSNPSGDFLTEGSAFLILFEDESVGDAEASTTQTAEPVDATSLLDTNVDASVAVSGSSTGIGAASAIAVADGFVFLQNNSMTETLEFSFSFDYGVSSSASVDDVLLEFAFASATASLFSSDSFDPLLEAIFVFDTDIDGADNNGALSDVFDFSIFVNPLSTADVFFTLDASGLLASDLDPPITTVSAPQSVLLLGFGLIGVAGLRGRAKGKNIRHARLK